MGGFKLNFDRSSIGNPVNDRIIGIIRNWNASNVLSFSTPVSRCTMNKEELLALRTGLREAIRVGLIMIQVEGNSLCVVRSISGRCKPTWLLAEEVLKLARRLQASFSHIKRSANKVADAKVGIQYQNLHISYDGYPLS